MFDLGKHFQPSLMFVGEARSLPWIEEPERSSTYKLSENKIGCFEKKIVNSIIWRVSPTVYTILKYLKGPPIINYVKIR
jgi:hypothetical protein